MECKEIIVGQSAIIDKLSNRVSIINLMDDLDLPSVPLIIPISVYSTYTKSESETDSVYQLAIEVGMDDAVLFVLPFEIIFREGATYAKNVASLAVQIAKGGKMFVRVKYEDSLLGSRDFTINQKG